MYFLHQVEASIGSRNANMDDVLHIFKQMELKVFVMMACD